MRKRTCSRSRLGRSSVARRSMLSMASWLAVGALALPMGCGDSSTNVPSEDEGLIEAPVEQEGGEGTQELTSDRKAK